MKIGKCYVCETGALARKKVGYKAFGILIGNFEAEVCNKCGETFFDEDVSREITNRTKEMGLWGLESKTRIGAAGSTLDIRLNKRLIDFLGIKKGMEVRVYPESKHSLKIEIS